MMPMGQPQIDPYLQEMLDRELLKMAGIQYAQPQPVNVPQPTYDYPQYKMDSSLLQMTNPMGALPPVNPMTIVPPQPNTFITPPSPPQPNIFITPPHQPNPEDLVERFPISEQRPTTYTTPPEPPKSPYLIDPIPEKIGDASGILKASGLEPTAKGGEIEVVRTGELDKEGGYFATQGSSTYYDTEGGATKYKITNAKIATSGTPEMRTILEKAKATATPEELKRINSALEKDNKTDNFVDYMLFDEVLSIKAAAEKLGYDGVKVWENDDIADPSSIFLWNTKKASKLSPKEAK